MPVKAYDGLSKWCISIGLCGLWSCLQQGKMDGCLCLANKKLNQGEKALQMAGLVLTLPTCGGLGSPPSWAPGARLLEWSHQPELSEPCTLNTVGACRVGGQPLTKARGNAQKRLCLKSRRRTGVRRGV